MRSYPGIVKFPLTHFLVFLAIAMFSAKSACQDTLTCNGLNKLAEIALEEKQLEIASHWSEKALEVCEIQKGKASNEYVTAVSHLCDLLYYQQKIEEAEARVNEGLEYLDQSGAPDAETKANLLMKKGVYRIEAGDFGVAENLLKQALEIIERNKKWNNELYSECHLYLGTLFHYQSFFEKAGQAYQTALDAARKVGGIKGENLELNTMFNMAALYEDTGDFEKALPVYHQLTPIMAKKPEYDRAFFLNNASVLYMKMGLYSEAERALTASLELKEKNDGKENQNYCYGLLNLAECFRRTNQYGKADSVYHILPGLTLLAVGAMHPFYGQVLANHAVLVYEQKNLPLADSLLTQALAIFEDNPGKDSDLFCNAQFNMASLQDDYNNVELADSLYRESFRIEERLRGKVTLNYASLLMDYGWMYDRRGRYFEALPFYEEADSILRTLIRRNFLLLPESRQESFFAQLERHFWTLGSFCYKTKDLLPESAALAFEDALLLKQFRLETGKSLRNTIYNSEDRALTENFNKWQEIRLLLVRQELPKGESDSLQAVVDNLEEGLAQQSYPFRKAGKPVSWQEVQSQLHKNEAAIEFYHFQYKSTEPTDSTFYVALLLRPGYEHPKMFYLFEGKDLAALFQNTGDEANNIKENYQTGPTRFRNGERTSRLYGLLWKPLEKHLRGVKKIYYSPSGLLQQVSFAAIAPKPGEVLADRYDLEYVTSTRELVIGRESLPGDTAHVRTAAVFGGIRYETDTTLLAMAEHKITCNTCPDDRGDRRNPEFLSGSLAEMRVLDSILSSRGIACDTFSGYDALESRVKSLSSDTQRRSPDVLHLSTHGYFYPDPKSARDSAAYDAPFKWADNPLFRSYLLMAGGLDAHLGKLSLGSYDDGILSAYEIAPLNLSNTKLVVLSACQTGLGDVKGSEGVYGLQRAFKMAGVERLLVTLWRVDDRATAAFMKSFYSHWLSGMDIQAAFRKALADVRATPGWEDPYFWAGFVLI